MTIKEFAEKYCVTKREIDYWTNLGLLHCTSDEENGNGRRIYDSKSEEEIKLILIAIAMDCDGTTLQDSVNFVKSMPKSFIEPIIVKAIKDKMNEAMKKYKQTITWARQL